MRIGELFAGYGGLGMGVKAALGGDVAWVSEVDKGANKVLAHRFPGVPNLGDITAIDWTAVEPVDVLTGGFPCQDLSTAGKRAGLRPGTRSGLWEHFAYAINSLRPRLVVIENVRGLLSARAHCDVEPCAFCVGDDTDGALRALGAVLGDLAGLGYDAAWCGLRAADVGAPHGRFRVFVVAYPADAAHWVESFVAAGDDRRGPVDGAQSRASDRDSAGDSAAGVQVVGRGAGLLPTPRSSDTNGAGHHGDGGVDLRTAVTLLPTPACNDMGEGKTVERWDEWTDDMKARHGNGNGYGKSLAIEAQRLLPTPEASRAGGTPERHMERKREADGRTNASVSNLDILAAGSSTKWGDYAAAIARWEHTLGRPAPAPTMTSSKGNPQLSPAFTEWMMGVPAGWITDTPGVTRNEALKLCGNGVVPAQAEAAIRHLLGVIATEAAA